MTEEQFVAALAYVRANTRGSNVNKATIYRPGEATTVYRVQTQEGQGPYVALTYEGIHDDDYGEVSRYGRRPAPYEDGLEYIDREQHYFGFASLDDLRHWFNEKERAFLAGKGFHIAVYRVATHLMRRGGCQCVFCKSQATLERVEALA